ncbi:MAG: cell division protein FtsK [Magnetococcales bacterium]|nr:cell division protein FtsK [Magnetococcales bacterium]
MVLSRFSIIDFLEKSQASRKERKEAAAKLAEAEEPIVVENIEPQEEKLPTAEIVTNTARSVFDVIAIIPAVVQRFISKLIQKSFRRQLDWMTPMAADPVLEGSGVRVEPEMDFSEQLHSEPTMESQLDDPILPDAPYVAEIEKIDISDMDEVEEEEEELFAEADDEDIPPQMDTIIEPVVVDAEEDDAEEDEEYEEESFAPEVEVIEEDEEPIVAPTLATVPTPNLAPLKIEPEFAEDNDEEFADEGPIPPMEIPVNMPKPMAQTPSSGTLESEEEAAKQDMPLPSLDMLTEPPLTRQGPGQEELSVMARLLEQKLADFKIKGQIIDVMPGPVVTTFELDPAPGLRASKVVTISDDLARSISAESVRVVGNVPGKTVIGIELPNEIRATVYLREVLQSEGFEKINHPLGVALGSDINGVPFSANLAKMPHLLVAGTTGSGKSVAVNAMICSILFNARPDEVRFLMIDPKMLELSIYEGIPHLLAPVVTDVHKAANLLKWAVAEMEERYRLMSELGVRNLVGFNQKIERCIAKGEQPTRRVKVGFDPETGAPVEQDEPIALEKKPLIVIVIDELADLMIQVGKEVEPAIARLAQMARAAGLHLVIATQRPSVDVITGLIKANFPTRLAFQVSSKIDSRTILDSMGAERLLGMGDGLYLPPGTSILKRIHAPFVSDEEVNDLVKYLKTTGTPQYNSEVLVARSEEDSTPDLPASDPQSDDYDELYDQAAAVVVKAGKVSTSMVQRHFKIGYNRAARMVERMEADGLISAANGAGKREVLAPDSGDFG